MFDELLRGFLSSAHGAEARERLATEHGLSDEQVSAALSSASTGASQALESDAANESSPIASLLSGLGGGGTGNTLMGALVAIVQGRGLGGTISGLESLFGGKIAEQVVARTGLDPNTARAVAATITPFVVKYLAEHGHRHSAPLEHASAR